LTTLLYAACVAGFLFGIFFRRGTIKKMTTAPFAIVSVFWVGYLFSGVFGVFFHHVEPKLLI
jgi:hypothetical protein